MNITDIVNRRTKVRVTKVIDDKGATQHLGRLGSVCAADIDLVGQPGDPLWTVRFSGGTLAQYWGEELAIDPVDHEARTTIEGGHQ
jgi:hypothetical protein